MSRIEQEFEMMPLSMQALSREIISSSQGPVIQKSKSDQPIDLRVSSAIERENSKRETLKAEKNFILASLLTSPRQETLHVQYREIINNVESKYCEDFGIKPRIDGLPLRNIHLNGLQEQNSLSHTFCRETVKRSIVDKLQTKGSFQERYSPGYKPWKGIYLQEQNLINATNISDYAEVTSTYNFNNTCDTESSPKTREFVPNYRKFYSRYANQSPPLAPSKKINRSSLEDFNKQNPDCTIIEEKLSRSNLTQPETPRWCLNNKGQLYRLLQEHKQASTENNVPCLKRKLPLLADALTSNKNKTLKGLLTGSVSETNYLTSNSRYFPHSSLKEKQYGYVTIKKEITSDPPTVIKAPLYTGYPNSPLHIYCPQPIRAVPSEGVSKCLPSSAPPSSGSPGSESTSTDGSTDSGVFSDVIDDRRRVSRVLSGRHVKSGTGASLATLRLLRQMILGRKNKSDRKL